MVRTIGTVAVILIFLGVIAYASGWISFQTTGEKATIEMNTGEMKKAADKAMEKGKEFIEKVNDDS